MFGFENCKAVSSGCSHKEMDQEEKRQAEWELEVPEPEPEPEGETEEEGEEEEDWEKEEAKEKKEKKEDCAEEVEDPNLTKEYLKESKKLYVDFDDSCVTAELS